MGFSADGTGGAKITKLYQTGPSSLPSQGQILEVIMLHGYDIPVMYLEYHHQSVMVRIHILYIMQISIHGI